MSKHISQFSVEVWAPAAPTPASYDCIDGVCIDPGDGSGVFTTLQECIQSGCGAPPSPPPSSGTFTFDSGLGNKWFLALQLSDSGIELRDKVIKALRATGKFSNARIKVYAYGPLEDILVDDIELGTNAKCEVLLPDTTQVQQSRRFQINVKNAMNHTIRIEGEWDGTGMRDRIDELIYEIARQGVRR